MLGFHISIYKLQNGATPAASGKVPRAERLAAWQTGWKGLAWIDDLVKRGLAVSLGGNGYPLSFTARIEHVRPEVLAGPPAARKVWHCDEGDILTETWEEKTTIDHEPLSECSPDEWVLRNCSELTGPFTAVSKHPL